MWPPFSQGGRAAPLGERPTAKPSRFGPVRLAAVAAAIGVDPQAEQEGDDAHAFEKADPTLEGLKASCERPHHPPADTPEL